MKRLLIVRPEPGNSASVAMAKALGLKAIAVPLFVTESLPWTAPAADEFDALLMTSANAPRLAGSALKQLASLPVYTVGQATASAAEAAGLAVAHHGNGNVADLLNDLDPSLRLLHLCGRDRTPMPSGRSVKQVEVYRSRPVEPAPSLPASGAVIAIHSPRAGRRVAELVRDKSDAMVVAISESAGVACGPGWQRVEIAGAPSDSSLLALAAKLCQTVTP